MSSTLSTKPSGAREGKATAPRRSARAGNGHAEGVLARAAVEAGGAWPEGAVDAGSGWHIAPATAADHHPIQQLLMRVFHAPSLEAFNASLEDPFYEPCDRLLVQRGERFVSHVLASAREMNLGQVQLPVTQISQLATLPEYRGKQFAGRLLQAAEAKVANDGAVMGLLTTSVPRFFIQHDWVLCGRINRWLASARDLLARLGDDDERRHTRYIRPWRHVELPALVRLYADNVAGTVGTFVRSEEYWRWLISRRAYDHIYVATESPGRSRLDDTNANVVGYAITRDEELLELMVEPDRPDVARQLLRRVCCDAIEMDCHHLALHAPPTEPLGELFRSVGGHPEPTGGPQGDFVMAKLPDPLAVLQLLCGQLHQRASAAGLERPCELGLSINGEKHRLVISRRSVKLAGGKLGRSYLRCDSDDFTRLLLGSLDIEQTIARGRLEASTRLAAEIAATLFPRLPLWRPPLDDLME